MPYSLHTKSFLFKHKNGRCDIAISSSNFAVRDLVKEENLLFIYDAPAYYDSAIQFFENLRINSVLISEFKFKEDYAKFLITKADYNANDSCGFIAPFYHDSSFLAEDLLKKLLQEVNERVIIVGQHICPIEYEFNKSFHTGGRDLNNKRSGLADVLVKKSENGVIVNIMSQTFASGDIKKDAPFRTPANKLNFIKFYNKIKNCNNLSYYVNENCHSKYIVLDNTVYVSTFNYTPTQFTYLDNVTIDNFTNNPGKSYEGIYAEVGQFVIIRDPKIVEKYVENFHRIISYQASIKIK